MKFKIAFLILAALFLVGCDDNLVSTNTNGTDKNGKDTFPAPQNVQMHYLGPAKVMNNDASDPMNGCRVYAFKVNDYVQTAVMCGNKVTVSSAAHQKKKKDDNNSTSILATTGNDVSIDKTPLDVLRLKCMNLRTADGQLTMEGSILKILIAGGIEAVSVEDPGRGQEKIVTLVDGRIFTGPNFGAIIEQLVN